MKERPILFSAPMVRALLAGTKTQTRRLLDPGKLRVRLDAPVTSDLMPGVARLDAAPGKHWARIHMQGAVSLALDGGELGVKPGEFHILCPYVEGTTVLADRGARGRAWTIIPAADQRLWVRETWYCDDYTCPSLDKARAGYVGKPPSDEHLVAQWRAALDFRADHDCSTWEAGCPCSDDDGRSAWRPSIFMPRWASRIALAVASARIERLHAITEEDARAEGVSPFFERFPHIGRDQRICDGELARDAPYRASFACLWDEINGDRALWNSNPLVWVVEFSALDGDA